ncbi:unnamed protein product [Trifolium pratense]|uniref:Uncharacterized protein n=1 Tax=Trifolium pratense TaxID=57577 RepID=A0ACB0IBK8_TRIPR|nr:unnamed protein product [Trifolium pratense]
MITASQVRTYPERNKCVLDLGEAPLRAQGVTVKELDMTSFRLLEFCCRDSTGISQALIMHVHHCTPHFVYINLYTWQPLFFCPNFVTIYLLAT